MHGSRKSYFEIALVLLVFLVLPFIDADRKLGAMLVQGVFTVMLVGLGYFACDPGWRRTVGVVLAVAAVACGWIAINLGSEKLFIAELILMLLALGFILREIIGSLLRLKRATGQAVRIAVAAYLLLGVFWATGFNLLHRFDEHAFKRPGENASTITWLEDDTRQSAFIYYSFVTLTTLGYGDMVPVSSLARMLAALEAVLGQLFMVILVARLVGMQIAGNQKVDYGSD